MCVATNSSLRRRSSSASCSCMQRPEVRSLLRAAMHLALAALALVAVVVHAEDDYYKILKVPRSATDAEVCAGALAGPAHVAWGATSRIRRRRGWRTPAVQK